MTVITRSGATTGLAALLANGPVRVSDGVVVVNSIKGVELTAEMKAGIA